MRSAPHAETSAIWRKEQTLQHGFAQVFRFGSGSRGSLNQGEHRIHAANTLHKKGNEPMNAENNLKARYLKSARDGNVDWDAFVNGLPLEEFMALVTLPKVPTNAEVALKRIAEADILNPASSALRDTATLVTKVFDIQNYASAACAGLVDPNDMGVEEYCSESDDFRAEVARLVSL